MSTNDYKPTVYEEMARQRVEVLATQINILGHYDSAGKEKRFQELYNLSHEAIVDEQGEHTLEGLDSLIRTFQSEIERFKLERPDIESPGLREKFSSLDEKLSALGEF